MNHPSFRLILSALFLAATVALIAYLCAFKVMDRDFWWHVKAGDVMRERGAIIQTEPFAYTREGEPYLATYEWLAQIVLSQVYRRGGPAGVILFRMAMVIATFLVLLAIDPRRLWPNGLFAVFGAKVALIGFLERPQLFTFLLFSLFLLLGFRYLETASSQTKRRILLAFVVLTALWVNLHGAAAIVGFGVVVALLFQAWYCRNFGDVRRLAAGVALAAAALLVSPGGADIFTYLWSLFFDRTVEFIYEWQPRPFAVYVKEIGPLWLIALAALAATRRRWLFCALVLAGTGFLSLRAVRHEMLFVFASIGVTIYELRHNRGWERFLHALAGRRVRAVALSVAAVVLMAFAVQARFRSFTVRDQIAGFGAFDLARGAYDFLDREGITGRFFNTYGIGGYLLFRGYPDRKVFIDGRNVDYGLEFMEAAFLAGKDPKKWRELEERYGFTVALVDYDAIKREKDIPYTEHLGANPAWALVYLDDWVAVYVKDAPEHRAIIERLRFRRVTPEYLEFGDVDGDVDGDWKRPLLEEELARVADAHPQGVKGNIALAKLLVADGRIDGAERLIRQARERQPRRPEVLALAAAIHARRMEWAEATEAYRAMLAFSGGAYPDINHAYIADVFERAGSPWRARWHRLRHGVRRSASSLPPEPSIVSPSEFPETSSGAPSLTVNPSADAIELNDAGVEHAQQGRLTEARQAFENALKLNPSFAEAWNNLGSVSVEEGKEEEAIRNYRKALELNPDYEDARVNLERLGGRD